MRSLIPLFPFVAALSLLACQGDDGPVAEGATAPENSVVVPSGSFANAAAAKAEARAAAVALTDNGMAWSSAADGSATFGPRGAPALLTLACKGQGLAVTRIHPATPGTTATLSFTGGGTASSMPMRSVAKPGGPGESEWRGEARGDMARAVARAFAGPGQVEVTLGGAPALAVPTSPIADAVLTRCAA